MWTKFDFKEAHFGIFIKVLIKKKAKKKDFSKGLCSANHGNSYNGMVRTY